MRLVTNRYGSSFSFNENYSKYLSFLHFCKLEGKQISQINKSYKIEKPAHFSMVPELCKPYNLMAAL